MRRALLAGLRGRGGAGGLLLALLALLALVLGLNWLLRRLLPCLERCLTRVRRPQPRGHERDRPTPDCAKVPPFVRRRPDPLLYSQEWLTAKGLSVTWDNPDIWLERGGSKVSSHELEPGAEYDVVAQIWNGSTDAPAIGAPVSFSFLSFGIGTQTTAIGSDTVDLHVKGSPKLPGLARTTWRTPDATGHYCLQARVEWPDDVDPGNNMGQENTDVKALNSPEAHFEFPVRNDATRTRLLVLEPDVYEIPALRPCGERPQDPKQVHGRGQHPVPEGWTVDITPPRLELGADESEVVRVHVVAPDGFAGEQVINVNAFADQLLVGGVTLKVHGEANR